MLADEPSVASGPTLDDHDFGGSWGDDGVAYGDASDYVAPPEVAPEPPKGIFDDIELSTKLPLHDRLEELMAATPAAPAPV